MLLAAFENESLHPITVIVLRNKSVVVLSGVDQKSRVRNVQDRVKICSMRRDRNLQKVVLKELSRPGPIPSATTLLLSFQKMQSPTTIPMLTQFKF